MSELDSIQVASPCTQSWEDMAGDEQVRFCGKCDQHVYQLAGMTRREAEDLILRKQGGERICIRLHRRPDGSFLTRDCPSRVRRQRRSWAGLARAAAAFVGALGASLSSGCFEAEATQQGPTQERGRRLPAAGAQPDSGSQTQAHKTQKTQAQKTRCKLPERIPVVERRLRPEMGEMVVQVPAPRQLPRKAPRHDAPQKEGPR